MNEVMRISRSSLYADIAEPDGVRDPQILRAPFILPLFNETPSTQIQQCDTYESIPGGHESLMTDEGQRCTHSPRHRPLPVIPLPVYEYFNISTSNPNVRRLVSRQICIILTVLFMFVATVVVVTTVLLIKKDDQKSKQALCSHFLILIHGTD